MIDTAPANAWHHYTYKEGGRGTWRFLTDVFSPAVPVRLHITNWAVI